MRELIERLRSYLPLGLECHWSQASKNYVTAFDLIESQAAEIASLQETLDAVTRVASDAENLVISQRDEIEKYKALCDQMATVMTNAVKHRWPYLDDMRSLIEAWRSMKMHSRETLELAAKAAGLTGEYRFDAHGEGCFVTLDGSRFNPLADEGDALMLAVRLGILNMNSILNKNIIKESAIAGMLQLAEQSLEQRQRLERQ